MIGSDLLMKIIILNLKIQQMSQWRYPNLVAPGKEKPVYKLGPSLMDETNSESQLSKSDFKGFYNMAIIFSVVFLFTKPILNKYEDGYFFENHLYDTFKQDYFLCILVWPMFFAWSFTSFFLQKLILLGIPSTLALILQHLTQAGLFIFSLGLILTKDWCSTHAAFVILQACAHFMKMHSYTTVNRDYREQKEQALRLGTQPLSDYPKNVNLRDFILFMWTPWLVYDTYPRKATISVLYILKKVVISITCIVMAYIIHTQYIQSTIQMGTKISYLQLIFRVMMPCTILILLLFYLTFENITNIFAQITRLDHREFYQDWWNSTTYEQFNRKWNKPVHLFLSRHVYRELMVRYGFSKNKSQMVTFLFSAALHEFLLAVIFRIVRPIFLAFIIGQVPLIYLTKFMRGKKSGSYLFWFGIIAGPSIIVSSYLRVHSSVTHSFTRVPAILPS